MDLHLPGESGVTCIARLKERLPAVQFIVLTVYKDPELIFQALKALSLPTSFIALIEEN